LKIQIVSDLHTEFLPTNKQEAFCRSLQTDANAIILAGDVCSHNRLIFILSIFSEMYEHVIYVNGNHELYGTHIDTLRAKKSQLPENVHWLDNNTVTINNQRFIGCTLWFPFDPLNQLYEHGMNDFRSIFNFLEYVYKENQNSVEYLTNNIQENDIVVTHYLPSNKSVNWKYFDSPLNRFFVCEMDDVIENTKPSYVIHGHSHCKSNYKIGSTRIICNPHGYPNENDNEFDWNKIIEV
jgi:Icc-related predicted phosphoesterase